MSTLAEKIAGLPPELQAKVERYVSTLAERASSGPAPRLTLGWIGALKDIDETRSSVEIQHDILRMWEPDVPS